MTSKLQLTVPKAIADHYGIRPGDEVQWVPAGEAIRVIPRGRRGKEAAVTLEERLDLFDQATERQRKREAATGRTGSVSAKGASRGWQREDLYNRGRSG